jgi:hypothetical protein
VIKWVSDSESISPERMQHCAFSMQLPPPPSAPTFSCLGGRRFDWSSDLSTLGPLCYLFARHCDLKTKQKQKQNLSLLSQKLKDFNRQKV